LDSEEISFIEEEQEEQEEQEEFLILKIMIL